MNYVQSPKKPRTIFRDLRKLHYISGLTISLFVGLHLINHLISVLGAGSHIELMEVFRKVYRNPILESLLLLAVLTQIISGLRLWLFKRKNTQDFFEKLQLWTGLYLAFFLVIHVSAVMSGRFILHLDTNFYFGVAGLNTFPLSLFFMPYYGLAICSFFGHVAAIHHQKMKHTLLGIKPHQQAYIILVTGLLMTVFIFYGLTNGFSGVDIPEDYHILVGEI